MEKERREMEVPARREVSHIEVRGSHLEHCSRVGKNMALAVVVQQDRDACRRAARDAFDFSDVDSFRGQSLQGDAAERIISKPRDEADRYAKRRQVVCENRRGTTQGQPKVTCQQLPLQRHNFRKSIENEV